MLYMRSPNHMMKLLVVHMISLFKFDTDTWMVNGSNGLMLLLD